MRTVVLGLGVLVTFALVSAFAFGQVVINEVAWAGTSASPSDEWIELYNVSDSAIDLTGWSISFGKSVIDLGSGMDAVLPANGYFLLERSDDTTVSDVEADLIYTGSLSNSGAVIELRDPTGAVIDTANSGCDKGWYAGAATNGYFSMERVNPLKPDLPSNWRTNDGVHRVGLDADGKPINGTPKAKNSATIAYETEPHVQVLTPAKEGETVSGLYLISWSAHDPDGDDSGLRIDIYFSSDGGNNWEPVSTGLANGGSYAWDTTGVSSGENCVIKVVATDPNGLFGEGISPVFAIANSG